MLSTSEKNQLAADLGNVIEQLGSLHEWIVTAEPTLTRTTDVAIDDYYYYVDLGQFGEQETSMAVEQSDVEVDVDLDVEELFRDESPIDPRYFDDDVIPILETALRLIESTKVDGSVDLLADVGSVESSRETSAGRAAMCAVREFLGDDIGSVRRALAEAFRLSVEESTSTSTAGIDYDPATVRLGNEATGSVRVRDLRFGDDITGGSFGRLVNIERATGGIDDRYLLTLLRDGIGTTREEYGTTTFYILPVDPPNRSRESYPSAVDSLDQ